MSILDSKVKNIFSHLRERLDSYRIFHEEIRNPLNLVNIISKFLFCANIQKIHEK